MKKYLKYLVILLLVVGAALSGFFWTRSQILENPEGEIKVTE